MQKKPTKPVVKKVAVKKTAKPKTNELQQIDDYLDSYTRVNIPIISEHKKIPIAEFYNSISKTDLTISIKNFRKTIENTFKRSDRNAIINDIVSAYNDEKLVFVIGAGVSINYGLPSWDILLQKLMVDTLQKEKQTSSILSKLFSKIFNPSPLIAGRYLQLYFEKNKHSFEDAVRKILYEEINRDTKSELVSEIIHYCIAPGKSPNLNSIITYNFDDIIETEIQELNLDLPYKSIYGLGMDVEAGELPIYHVHGFLPEKEKLTDANKITFGENIYHQQYNDTYSWNNIVQINKFREYSCIFIGTSLTDPNTRRLLDISNQQKTKEKNPHFIFKMKYKKDEVKKALEALLEQNMELLNEKSNTNLELDEMVHLLIETIESFEENDLKSFGIKTIWIERYSEIPEILRKIREPKKKIKNTPNSNSNPLEFAA